ncbi:MAG: hypothetical protein IJN29_11185 [Akkermansia sp.]|nr:hypothetical protein [Akkermansia sp.]
MKLHLPKTLLAAVVAIGLTGGNAAHGLTVNIDSFAETATTYDTATNFSGNSFSYDASTGNITYNGGFYRFECGFTLDYDAFAAVTASTNLLYISAKNTNNGNNNSWGFRASASDTIIGKNGNSDRTDGNTMSATDLQSYVTGSDTAQVITGLEAVIDAAGDNKTGTVLTIHNSTDNEDKDVYNDSGLKYTPSIIGSVTLNKNLISSISLYEAASYTVTNADSTWTKTYSDAAKVRFNGVATGEMDATIINKTTVQVGIEGLANAGDIIVGGSGQLFLQTYSSSYPNATSGRNITLSNDIYLGASTGTTDNAALQIATYSGTVVLNGNVYLVENAKIAKEKDKTTNGATGNAVTFNGDVAGNYTLTLESLSSETNDGKFEDVIFAGNVDISGLILAESNGSDVVFSNAAADKTVQIDTLTTKSGAHKLTFDETTSIGSLSMETGSTLALAGSGAITITNGGTLSGTIENIGSGGITWGGSATIAEITDLESSGAVTYSENNGLDGYISKAEYYLVKGTGDNTSASVSSGDWKLNDTYNITQSADGKSVVVNVDESDPSGSYFVNTTVNYGGENSSTDIVADTTTRIVMNGGTLNLNKALAEGVTISNFKEGSVIHIGAGVTLDNSSVSSADGTATLAGVAATEKASASIYNMGVVSMNGGNTAANNMTKLNAEIGEGWQGTVVFEKGSSLQYYAFNLNDFGVAGSTIQFNGVAAGSYLGKGTDNAATYAANIELKGDGFSIENGFSGTTYTFTGAFSGSGSFNMNKAALEGQYYVFSGDMSQWTGELKQSQAAAVKNGITYTYSYTFNENSTTIANKVTAAAGTMVVNVDNDSAVSMTGDVTADGGVLQLTKTGGSKLTVNNLSAKGSNVELTGTGDNAIEVGTLSVASGKTVTGTADVTVTGKLDANRTEGVALTGALTLKDGVTVDVTDLLQDDTYTYNLASATNGVTVGTYSVTGLGDAYSSYQGRVSAVDPNAAAGVAAAAEGNSNTNLVLTLELVKLTVTSATGYENGVLTLTTAEKATGVIFGKSLDASVSDDIWAQITKDYTLDEEYSITFVGADGTTFDFDGDGTLTAPTITFMGETATALTENGTIVGTFTIPEPTTATLSLLALAALAARRRRR